MAQITLNSSGVASNGTLKLQSNGTTDAVTIDTSQNVGIGTSSPSRKLEVYSTSASFGKITAATTNQSVLEINNNGGANNFYIGIDTSTGGSFGAGSYGRVLYSDGAFPIVFSTNSSERMRIDSSGNLLVGTTSATSPNPGIGLAVGGNAQITIGHDTSSPSGQYYMPFKYNATLIGGITQNGTTAVAYNTSSDYRLKENIAPMTGALARVAALKPCTYTWKVDGSAGEGFIAHELAQVCPQAVSGEKDAVNEDGSIKPQGIDTSFLVATLTAAIQELKQIVDAQAETLATQAAEIAQLKGAQQ
jgi:hypothetical protein